VGRPFPVPTRKGYPKWKSNSVKTLSPAGKDDLLRPQGVLPGKETALIRKPGSERRPNFRLSQKGEEKFHWFPERQ